MRKNFFLLICGIFSFIFLSARSTEKINQSISADPRATFDKLWVDYDVYEEGVKGMKIHVKFTAYDMLNMDSYLAIYFQYDDEVGGWLKDKNGKFTSSEGDVAVYKSLKPQYNPALFSDLYVFMPYDELDLTPGEWDLAMDVKLIYKAGGIISKLTTYYFEYTKPGSTTAAGGAPANSISATFKDLTVDYDIYENSQKGMRIHTKFSVKNMKSTEGFVAIYFEKKNGDRLKSSNADYRSSSGQLAVYRAVTPGYDDADYNDLTLFIPYSVFDLPSGRSDLKMDVDLIYKAGGMIQHLKYYEFWMTK